MNFKPIFPKKSKIRFPRKLKIASASLLALVGATTQIQAQHAASAVMSITVSVVASPKLVNNLVTDITDQLQETTEDVSLGDYSIKYPEHTGYTVSFDPVITMRGVTGSWDINALVNQEADSEGKLKLSYTGRPTNSQVLPGKYTGHFTTQIVYN